jgi:exopolysaccharide biosynthesis protein
VGAYHAINVDGGGSSDAVLRGQIWSRPTCQDTPTPICERNVTSVTCIRYAQ